MARSIPSSSGTAEPADFIADSADERSVTALPLVRSLFGETGDRGSFLELLVGTAPS
jgi:hypothetical protein